jgi:hypothetical protein
MQVASLCETMLGDLPRAESLYQQALAIDPKNAELALPAARALERLYTAWGNHRALADALATEVGLETDADARRQLLARPGELAESVLDDPARAVAARASGWTTRPATA